MNPLIKHTIKGILTIVFISAAVVSVYAQGKKDIIKGVEATLGKKSPGVAVVSTRVPANLTGTTISQATTNQALERFIVPQVVRFNPTLNKFLMRKIATSTLSWDFATTSFTFHIIRQIEKIDLDRLLESNKKIEAPSYIWDLDEFEVSIDFAQLITEDMPEFIPVKVNINSAEDTKQMLQWREMTEGENKGIGLIKRGMLIAAVEKVDKYFFVEDNGQLYINKRALTQVHSYRDALGKLALKVPSNFFSSSLFALSKLVDFRNKQIINALNNSVKPQIPDVITQRTAEEIKFLLENLDPQNPLRQTVEGALKDNGYIVPAE